MDRRQALVRGESLPERCQGAALFADISGFTPLAQSLAAQLGPQRGAEELTFTLNQVYDALIGQVHRHGGSVIGFVGDAITCWFDEPLDGAALRSTHCALAMQAAMTPFAAVTVTPTVRAALSIKIGLAVGPARRLGVGDPAIQRIDVLAGETLRWMSQAEGQARRGEVLLDETAAALLRDSLTVAEWRSHPDSGRRLAQVTALDAPLPAASWLPLPPGRPTREQLRPWVLASLYGRLKGERGQERAELRPAVSLFLRFSDLDYDRDAAAGAKLDAYICWVQRVVTRHGGSLIQLTIGDKGSFLYAAFGAPVAHDDDALRAVQAGLELGAPPLTLDFAPDAQIGIARGPARTGEYGSATRRSYGVIGDDAVLAARLMTAAPPGEMRCAHSIYRELRTRLAFEALPPVRVKGKAGLVRVYRPTTGPSEVAVGGALIGRQAEMVQLQAALDTVQAGEPRVLIVEGEAGIGKSRLVEELRRLAQERGLTGLLGGGQSIEQQTPYRAWREVFVSYFDLEGVSDVGERRARVQSLAPQLVPGELERLAVLNDVLGLGLPEPEPIAALGPELRQQNVMLLLTALLRAWTAERPLLLVLEDAHWLDSLSWRFALQLARALSLARAPFLLVVVNRPLEASSTGGVVSRQLQALPAARMLELGPFAPAELVALVANRLDVDAAELPIPLVELMQTRSGGNPFFAEELLATLRDQDLVTVVDGVCRVSSDLAQAQHALPDTLHGLVLARIDRLSPERQVVLKVAAVIGRSFFFRLLHHACERWRGPMAEAALRGDLAALNRRDFTFVEALEPELTYVFKHIITQEAAYRTLLYAQRRELHTIVAEWYAAQPALMPYLPLLVHHYRQAERTVEECRYAGLAGEQAARYYDNENALHYFSRALELMPEGDLEARYGLLWGREAVNGVLGRREAQLHDLALLAELADALHDAGKSAAVNLRWAIYADAQADYGAALRRTQEAVEQARRASDVALQGQVHHEWGRISWKQGQYAAAREQLKRALLLAQFAGDRLQEARSLYDLGLVEFEQGNHVNARERFLRAQALYQEMDYRPGVIECLLMFGMLDYQGGDYMAAQSSYDQALSISQAIGWRLVEARVLSNMGNNRFDLGDYAKAGLYHRHALMICREIDSRIDEAIILDTLSLIAYAQQDYATADDTNRYALALQREIGDLVCEGYSLNHRGLILSELGDLPGAEDAFRQALRLRRDLSQTAAAVDDLAGLARVALAQGEIERAAAWVEEILAWLAGHSPDGVEFPVLVYLSCYRVLRAVGDEARARDVLATGCGLLQERAAAIHDPALRVQFLENVPFNRELLAACEGALYPSLTTTGT